MVVFAVLYMCFEYLPATIVLAKGLMLGGLSKRRQVFEVASKSASDGPLPLHKQKSGSFKLSFEHLLHWSPVGTKVT